jgi:hypothetical protein
MQIFQKTVLSPDAKQGNFMNIVEMLVSFVNQRPGLDFADYGDVSAYRKESREITADKHDFFELLSLAQRRIDNFPAKLETYLTNTDGRLTLEDGRLQYCAGQYFPTEYRPAANGVLKSFIWNSYRDEKHPDGTSVYTTGPEIRKAIKRNLSTRVGKLYFN